MLKSARELIRCPPAFLSYAKLIRCHYLRSDFLGISLEQMSCEPMFRSESRYANCLIIQTYDDHIPELQYRLQLCVEMLWLDKYEQILYFVRDLSWPFRHELLLNMDFYHVKVVAFAALNIVLLYHQWKQEGGRANRSYEMAGGEERVQS